MPATAAGWYSTGGHSVLFLFSYKTHKIHNTFDDLMVIVGKNIVSQSEYFVLFSVNYSISYSDFNFIVQY